MSKYKFLFVSADNMFAKEVFRISSMPNMWLRTTKDMFGRNFDRADVEWKFGNISGKTNLKIQNSSIVAIVNKGHSIFL